MNLGLAAGAEAFQRRLMGTTSLLAPLKDLPSWLNRTVRRWLQTAFSVTTSPLVLISAISPN
jgi:hypothetical protein